MLLTGTETTGSRTKMGTRTGMGRERVYGDGEVYGGIQMIFFARAKPGIFIYVQCIILYNIHLRDDFFVRNKSVNARAPHTNISAYFREPSKGTKQYAKSRFRTDSRVRSV